MASDWAKASFDIMLHLISLNILAEGFPSSLFGC